jgi:ABC-2 type transport system ATP-binding protein
MTDRPHVVTIRSSDDRALAARLWASSVFGVTVDNGSLSVRSSDLAGLSHALPRLARDTGVTLIEMFPADESLESVFTYLVSR